MSEYNIHTLFGDTPVVEGKRIWSLVVKRQIGQTTLQIDITNNLTFSEAAAQGRSIINTYVSEGWTEHHGSHGNATLTNSEVPYWITVYLEWERERNYTLNE